jgi:hypothetical protein
LRKLKSKSETHNPFFQKDVTMRELVFNEAVSSLTGLPISDDDELMVDNCACDEAPLVPPSLFSAMPVVNEQFVGEGEPLVPPVLNFSAGDHSFDRSGLGVEPRVGQYPQDREYGLGAPPRADFNDDYENRLEESNRENRRKLGLLDEDEGQPLVQPSMVAAAIADSRQGARSRK